jgi:hypothetical protein
VTARDIALLLACAATASAGEKTADPLADPLIGKRCLLFRYVASNRNASFGQKDDLRRPVTTYVEGSRTKYVASWLLELRKTLSEEQLAWYDARLQDKPGLRGFQSGEVAVVTEVERKDDEVAVKIRGEGADERKGKLVFKYEQGVPPTARALEDVWRTLLPEPPYATREDEARAMAAVVHGMPLTALSDWMRRPPEETIRQVATASLALQGLAPAEAEAIRRCYEESYLALSDRSGLALLRIGLDADREGRVLTVEGRPHLPFVGDWPGEGARADAAVDWTVAKILKTLPRKWTGPALRAYHVVVEYDFRSRDGWGHDRLESELPAAAAAAYADLKIGTKAMAAQGDHRLNGMPVSVGERTAR